METKLAHWCRSLLKRRSKEQPCRDGFTLLEVLLVAGLTAAVILALVALMSPVLKFLRITPIRQTATREARTCMDTIKRVMTNGQVSTLVISTPPGSPTVPHSRAEFLGVDGSSYTITWSSVPMNTVYLYRTPVGGNTSALVLATHVKELLFTLDMANPGLIGVTLLTVWPLDGTNSATNAYTTLIPNQIIQMSVS